MVEQNNLRVPCNMVQPCSTCISWNFPTALNENKKRRAERIVEKAELEVQEAS